MEEAQITNQISRDELHHWQSDIHKNIYSDDKDLVHTIAFSFPKESKRIHAELTQFGEEVVNKLEPLVNENNLAMNLPQLELYNSIGERINKVAHHPSYIEAGNIIYRSKLLAKMKNPGGLLECLSFLFLSSQTGEAGHNCPIACSAGIIRVLQRIADFPEKSFYLEKLTDPSFENNFTGAQFLTEIQGGSDVGLNTSYAKMDLDNVWRIYGEKWFCSNAGADLIFITARYDEKIPGTKGLGLFLVPAEWKGKVNHYSIRRLKNKIGTRSMATGEIDFQGAYAIPIGQLNEGFHLAMNNVLHLSRLFNAFCVLGMARRAYFIAHDYAKHRIAFGSPIFQYPLVQENLAKIKAENTALMAGMFAVTKLQDQLDSNTIEDKNVKYLLRLLVNIQKYMTALWSVEHIHRALDVLAGNGTIETFSSIPRLLRDCIVCENWEGTHNVLRMQVLKDILKYHVDDLYLTFMRDQLKNIDDKNIYKIQLMNEINDFEIQLKEFKQEDAHLQSLQIRLLVDKMAALYNALMLLLEANHQIEQTKRTSKLNCFVYFSLLHLSKDKITYDKNYLNLITQIIEYDK